jgi:hypothetical protein
MKEIHSKYEIVIFENKAAKTLLFIQFWRIINYLNYRHLVVTKQNKLCVTHLANFPK